MNVMQNSSTWIISPLRYTNCTIVRMICLVSLEGSSNESQAD